MEFKIKSARESAGFSQKDLAKIIGVAPSTFNGYESGNHDPKSDLLVKIALACGVTVDFLLGLEENSPSTAEVVPVEDRLIKLYHELNAEGQHLVVDYADTLVASGKYKKVDSNELDKERLA